MYLKQHTIQQEITLEGMGLHTGATGRITFKPAPENHGFAFKCLDVQGQPTIKADLENVVELQRSTTLASGGGRVQTVEHVLAALSGLQIDNCLMEVTGPETPILDGSALEYTHALKQAGLLEQKANREFYIIDQPIHYQNNERSIDLAALQFNDFRVTVLVDYNSPFLGIQHATMVRLEDFEAEIAPSRTFCFFHELESLVAAGLIKGGSTDNAIVIVDKEVSKEELAKVGALFNRKDLERMPTGILNNVELRYANEPARHKLLDLIGDLTLVGAPLKAQILAARPGHASNIAFGRLIKNLIKQKKLIRKFQNNLSENFVFDINAIQKILPHRYPFLLVDRIIQFDEKTITGVKNVTINEPFFQGHFDGNPIMPGVLLIEAMAQVGGVHLLNIVENPDDHWVYLLAIEEARFRKPVIPGDQVIFKLELLSLRRGICKMKGQAFVDGVLVCEATLVASLVKRTAQV